MDDTKRELILWYLNYNNIKLSEKEIFEQSEIYNIPLQIFIKKLIERLVTEHKAEKSTIIEILTKKMNLEISGDFLKYTLKLIEIVEPIIINSRPLILTKEIINKLELFNKLNSVTKIKATHKGQPIPDPYIGRPYINWKECYHEGCHKKFCNEEKLIEHLKIMGVYTHSYHRIHEEIISQNKLTETEVYNKNMKVCPAWICQYNDIDSPKELIEHFQRLGLSPFFKKGMDFTSKVKVGNYVFTNEMKIYNFDSCIVCLDNKPNIILDKCLHCCYCIDCFLSITSPTSNTTWDIQKCPVCKIFYSKVYPY
jgi:hypothetical protein